MQNKVFQKAIRVLSGRFDGVNMVSEAGDVYPVNGNYASKSRLVEGDYLKLTVLEDGSFIYKVISQVPRERVVGIYLGDNEANSNDRAYKLLISSVSYFKPKIGDKLSLIVPKNTDVKYAALDAVLGDVGVVGTKTDMELQENLMNLG